MPVSVNDVLKPSVGGESLLLHMARVLDADASTDDIWLFFIEKPYRSPMVLPYSVVTNAVASGQLVVAKVVPVKVQEKALCDLEDRERKAMEKHWQRLEAVVAEENRRLLLKQDSRGRLLVEAAKKHGVSYPMMLKDLYQYWAYGCTPLAFVPRWYLCGPKGQIQQEGHRKRGRRAKSLIAETTTDGVALTPTIREKLLAGIRKFIVPAKPPGTAFEQTLGEFFADGYTLEGGKVIPVLDPSVPKPTIYQFNYLLGLEKGKLTVQHQLVSEREWNLKIRPVVHRAAHLAFGPCRRYEVDATIVDIYLVCSFNRKWIIGRPVLYVIVDVWSRAVVGFLPALEGPSWDTARYALYSAFSDKQALCARYGRTIAADEWPCMHLPFAILGDRGEIISKASDELPRSLNIDAENAAAFRGDWKPFVERQFGLIQNATVHFMPGAVLKPGKVKGMRDPRLNAALTLFEFRQIILECLLRFNRTPRDGKNLPAEYVAAGHSSGSPIDVWKWGLVNMTGAIRRFDESQVLTHLLPSARGIVKEDGIHHGGLRYTSNIAAQEEWFTRARMNKQFSVEFRVEPSNPLAAWTRKDASMAWEQCQVLDEDAILAHSTGDDVLHKLALVSIAQRDAERVQLNDDVQSTARISEIVEGAIKSTEQAQRGMTKSELLKDIREKRNIENQVLKVTEKQGEAALSTTADSNSKSLSQSKQTDKQLGAFEEQMAALAKSAWEGTK